MAESRKTNLAIIPARGGSKRLPGKNIRLFLGKPVIAYPITAALECGIFDEVMVSTDSEEIRETALSFGANVPFIRSAENASDHAILADVVEEVLNEYSKVGRSFDNVCCILPASPLLESSQLLTAYTLLEEQKELDAVVPIVKIPHPVQRAFVKADSGFIEYKWKEYITARSQDLEPFYYDPGMFWFLRTVAFRRERILVPQKSHGLELSDLDAQDIDTPEDWKMAEWKFRLRQEQVQNS